MAPTKDLKQTLCLYCSKRYKTPINLARHIKRKHKGTYAEESVADPILKEKENRGSKQT